MPKTPFLEKSGSLQALGAGFIVLVLLAVWLSWAFFAHAFEDREFVTLKSATAGQQLPDRADVKLRGMIVGEVQEITGDGDGITMKLGIKPELMKEIPAGVSAQIIPKTLFGQKYVSLIPPEEPVGGTLQAGDVIEKAEVPIEVEKLLNDAFPLLDSIKPADLSYTLSALSTALGGRGEKLGDTLVDLNSFLTEINPDVPALVNDLVQLGNVSGIYADSLPDLARLLDNASTTSQTIVSQRQQLVSFFNNTTALANTLDAFVEKSDKDIIALSKAGTPLLEMIAKYSPSFPCFQEALTFTEPRIANAFRGGKLHIDGQFFASGNSPTGYKAAENVEASESVVANHPLAQADCLQLNQIIDAVKENPDTSGPYPNTHPYSFQEEDIYKLVNIHTRHKKFCVFPESGNPDAWEEGDDPIGAVAGGPCSDEPLPRSAASGIFGDDSDAERDAWNAVIGARLGLDPDEVPDVASLLVGPVLRGSVVSFE